jgi:ABC-type branched-subunit amino acid transport system substrate-binding protein
MGMLMKFWHSRPPHRRRPSAVDPLNRATRVLVGRTFHPKPVIQEETAPCDRRLFTLAAPAWPLADQRRCLAQKKYDTGATDKEIKIGNIMPVFGPGLGLRRRSARRSAPTSNKVNAEGGINGRKINFISLDDGYNPAKTVEQARKLVEEEEVLFVFNTLGTPPNSPSTST